MGTSKVVHRCRRLITWVATFANIVYATYGNALRHYDSRATARLMIYGALVARVITPIPAVPVVLGRRTCFLAVLVTIHFVITERSNFCVKANASASCAWKLRQERLLTTADSMWCWSHFPRPSYLALGNLRVQAKDFWNDIFLILLVQTTQENW